LRVASKGSNLNVNMGLPSDFSDHVASLIAWFDTWNLTPLEVISTILVAPVSRAAEEPESEEPRDAGVE
jgi:hypothetical protein